MILTACVQTSKINSLDPKDPSPARVLCKNTTQNRPQHASRSKHDGHNGSNVLLLVVRREFRQDNHRDAVKTCGIISVSKPLFSPSSPLISTP